VVIHVFKCLGAYVFECVGDSKFKVQDSRGVVG
jgi:hypothetical protein